MINFSKVSSLALGLALVGGLGLSNLASANTSSTVSHSQIQSLLAKDGSDRLQQNRVAEGGSDRLIQNRVAEGGSDRLIQNRVAEGGSDRLIQNRVAEGGADRLQELRERVASIPSNALLGGVIVAENRAEFGSKYQRY
ncbi:hypothetical protein KVG88_25805 [Pseudomonas sp. SWRI74]|jgi:hypothetical protein|uniref:Phage infection protein n=1 Tax=Pseudomonas azerbaijanoccidentalis TaxID=2842347 RepID=A0ABS6QX40_9PSED|nr:hypothetical protein [Pseudomonas azerbaijanoccidentalis]MBV4523488.1 hypothetical protein [Pseudomonas azerbaijanoccidentalis]